MARLARKTKNSRRKRSARSKDYGLEWDARRYTAEASDRMEVYDSLSQPERELIDEYGFNFAYPIMRQLYGHWGEVREVLEEARKQLQVSRLRNIT